MIGARDQAELVSHFYEAAIGSATWEAALARAAELFRSQATLFSVHRQALVVAARSHNYEPRFLADYTGGAIYAEDPRVARIVAVAPGSIYFDEMLYDPVEMAADPRVQAAVEALGMSAQLGARLRLPQGGEATLGILRRAREPDALVDRVRAIAGLAPRFEQACAVGYMVEREHATRDSLLACLAAKADGVILLDGSGRITFMNDAARDLLAEEDGLAFRDGLFCAARRPETEGLRKLVADSLAGGAGGGRMLVSRASRRKPYVVSLLASPAHETFLAGGSIACIVHIEDLAEPPAPAAAGLAGVFGLTGREAMLAAALVRTARLDSAASECGMAVNTARNHLQAIFAKTGTCGQAELVQLLGRVL